MKERRIERRLISALPALGFANADVIRRCTIGPGIGVADLVLLPRRGPLKVVLVEAKLSAAPDATGKVVGQLLLYHARLSKLGAVGLGLLRAFSRKHRSRARGVRRKSLQAITGCKPAAAAWDEMCRGRRVSRPQIGLYVALEAEPSDSLKELLTDLSEAYGLKIGVLTALPAGEVKVWPA
jgi:hypothetical protein